MSFPLSYSIDGQARLDRLRCLYTERPQDRIFAAMEIPAGAIERFAERYRAGYAARPAIDERIAFWDELLRERMAVLDDTVPCAYLSEQDQGLYGGIVGGSIQYMAHTENGWISSMVPPILSDWGGFGALDAEAESEPWRYYLEQLTRFREHAGGRFGISHFILIDSLNFLFELFGATRSYLEVEDNPGLVRQAIDFAYRLNVRVQRMFFEQIPLVEGGTCSNMAGWLPGRVVSESVDPYHMTSVDYFERWGREPVQRIFDTFDGGVLHLHGNGRHLLRAVATLGGLKGVLLANDRGYAPAITVVGRLKPQAGDVPLVVDTTFGEFVEAFDQNRLAGGCLYKIHHVPDADTANRWMDRIRDYRV